MTAYNPNIPNGNTRLNQDWVNIKNNFGQLNTTYGTDHIPLTTVANNGFHRAVHMVQQVAPAAVSGVGSIYCTTVNDGIDTDEILYYKTGLNKVIQLTRNLVPQASSNGYTFLPGGILFQWGLVNNPGLGGTVTFATLNKTFPNNIFGIQVSAQRGNTVTVVVANAPPPSVTGFNYIFSNNTANVLYWTAIGN
jgi:hypothetical protein